MTFQGRDWDNPESMLGVDDALQEILSAFSPLPAIDIPSSDGSGLILAQDVRSGVNVPPFANSAMDGYALRSIDTSDSPAMLNVIDTVSAGHVSEALVQPGTAYRIMTGAPVPAGADAVIRFEETSVSENRVTIHRSVQPNENIRMAGEDVAAGDIAIPSGARIRPQEIGVLASIDVQRVQVHRRPRVGVLSTGDEVAGPGVDLQPGMIRDANLPMIAAAVRQAGGDAIELGVVRDSEIELRRRFAGLPDLDLLIVTGGVSVGDFDLVKHVMTAEGEVRLWQVRMKPGKPLAFGSIAGVNVIGLPGNPVAALVAFHQFARASILTMLGRQDLEIPTVSARLIEPVDNRGRRRHYVRGTIERKVDEFHFRPSAVHGSAMLKAAASSNCYLVVPESVDHMDAGDIGVVQLPDEGL